MTRIAGAIAALAMGAACATAPSPAIAQTANAETSIQRETTLSLTGNGSVERAPDIAMISVGVTVEGRTATDAMEEQASRMTGVFEALAEADIAEKDMQTSNLSLNPRYDYSSKRNSDGGPLLIGYTASNQLTVIVRDLENLGDAMDAVVRAGGNQINSVSFGLDDPTAAIAEARASAMKDALAKAELYAEAAGYQVERIVTISEDGGWNPGPMPVAMARMSDMESAPSTPISAGEVSYSASVSVMLELVK
ncbi:MAG: SIMPL domain-containing protein [Pseudomonadota bacterium]